MAPLTTISTDAGYPLSRDFNASIRLNGQHWLWHYDLGYNLHPSINVPSNANIAEVAAGTGAWLFDVAQEHPNAQCDGFDISLQQAPPSVWLPSNVSMSKWDMYDSPPKELIGRYEIVHIRLVTLAMRSRDAASVVQNVSQLLKPGGWLQWEEPDVTDTVIMHTAGESGKVDTVKKMDYLMKTHGSDDWVLKLATMMKEVGGFAEVEEYRVKPKLSIMKFHMDNSLGSWSEIISSQPEGSEQRKNYEQLAIDLLEEVKQGAAHAVTKLVCVGKKAA